MKIYILRTTEEGATCIYSENNKVDLLDMWKKYSQYTDNDNFIDDWDTFLFYLNDEINKNKIKQNIMRAHGGYFISDDKTKGMLEPAFGEYIQFLDTVNEDDLSAKYHMFYPVRSLDALDIERSKCRFLDDKKLYISKVYTHVFKNDIEYYPVFKLRREEIVNDVPVYVTDEFKNYIEEKNITGFNFIEIYDSETYNSTKETAEETKTPAEETTTFNSKNFPMGKQMIPMAHEDGVFALGNLDQSSGECLTVEYFSGMITNSANSYTVYDIDDCDMAKDIEVTYRSGRLGSVYVNFGKVRIPVYMCFDFSSEGESEELTKAVGECAGLCAEDLMNELKKYPRHIGALSLEYYYDGEQMNINLQDREENIYPIGRAASDLLRCICICAGEMSRRIRGDRNFGYTVFECILEGVRERLSEDIPKRFKVSGDFEVSEPKMYD